MNLLLRDTLTAKVNERLFTAQTMIPSLGMHDAAALLLIFTISLIGK